MPCPICHKRKPQRFCPALGEDICSICCGTEREVTIDCPMECPYLIASRAYELQRRNFDWSKLPFADIKIPASFAHDHAPLLNGLTYAICVYARERALTVDADVLASLEALAESYRTLASGIYYERPPEHRLQRELYAALKSAIEEYKQMIVKAPGAPTFRDGDVRDALIFFTQLGATYSNGRPKCRAFLHLLRSQIKAEEISQPASNIVLLP